MSMISSSIFRTATVAARVCHRRPLSTTCTQSLDRLNSILENYRVSNYSRELPRRFRNDIVSAASKKSGGGQPGVSVTGIELLLSDIGAGDQMSHDEIESLLRECGGTTDSGEKQCVISEMKLLDLISNRVV